MLDQDRKDFQKEKELDDNFIDDNDSLEGFIVNIDDSNDSDEDEYLVKKKEQLSRESSAGKEIMKSVQIDLSFIASER